ncbi:hypothetical protein [Bacillus sp. AFS055030]|uniref:hypothetical protein n=1 Tax=Bacillus sp. AFS055030 TaxID=2033507 RepID=UPI000BFE75EE|nr:hypothetical protein [Bacillus sp. AFS055030]PGL69869.1 hypothetical protein CN925_14190 [Bacillus sp. AFS055030]
MNNFKIKDDLRIIATLQRDLNVATAALLLTGQITLIGAFVTSGEFSLSLSGPLLGRERIESKYGDQFTNTLIDVIDIMLAILLIIDEIRVVSSVIGPGRFTLNVSGPIFGAPVSEPTLPFLKKTYYFCKKIISKHFDIDPRIFSK